MGVGCKTVYEIDPLGWFHKDRRMAQIIEIALLKLGARRKARSTPVKSFSKVQRKAQIGRKTVYEIDPRSWTTIQYLSDVTPVLFRQNTFFPTQLIFHNLKQVLSRSKQVNG